MDLTGTYAAADRQGRARLEISDFGHGSPREVTRVPIADPFGVPYPRGAKRHDSDLLGGVSATKYRVLIEPDEDGVFVAHVPAPPGCVSQGLSREQALSNIREAIAGYLDSLSAHDEPIPPAISEEIVEVAV